MARCLTFYKVVKKREGQRVYTGPMFPGVKYKIGSTIKARLNRTELVQARSPHLMCGPGINCFTTIAQCHEFIMTSITRGSLSIIKLAVRESDVLKFIKLGKCRVSRARVVKHVKKLEKFN